MRQALFALAEKIGAPDPDALGQAIPGRLLTEWVLFWKVQSDAAKSPK